MMRKGILGKGKHALRHRAKKEHVFQAKFAHSFLHSFTHLSTTYSLPGSVLIAGDSVVSKTISILRADFLVQK